MRALTNTIEPRKYGSSARHATVPAGGLGELVEQRENVGVALPTMAFIQLRGGDESVVFQPVQSISGSAYEGVYQTYAVIFGGCSRTPNLSTAKAVPGSDPLTPVARAPAPAGAPAQPPPRHTPCPEEHRTQRASPRGPRSPAGHRPTSR